MQFPPEPPPIKPVKPTPMPVLAPMSSSANQRGGVGPVGTKRLRQIVGYIAGGGMALVLTVCGGERVLREGLRPTDLMAAIEARTELGIMNQRLTS